MKLRLGDLTTIKTGKLDANASSPDGDYPFFTCAREPLRIATYSYDCECVLVAGNGDLNVKYYNGKFDAYQRTYIIEDNGSKKLYLPYLYYFMDFYLDELRKQSVGGIIKYIRLANLTDAMIELLDLDDQRSVSDKLSRVSGLINTRRHELVALDDLVKSRFVEMFGDPIINPKSLPIGSVTDFSQNLDSMRVPITQGDRVPGPYPYFGASGVVDSVADYVFDETLLLVSEDGANLLLRSTPIAFTISGKTWVNNHAHVLRCRDDNARVYLETYINMIDISEWVTGTAQPKLNQKKLNQIPVLVPDEPDMVTFSSFVSQVDKSKSVVQKSIEQLELLKAKLMQEYFG